MIRFRIHGHTISLCTFDLDIDAGLLTPAIVAFVRVWQKLKVIYVARNNLGEATNKMAV
jgi:hypothetical protein